MEPGTHSLEIATGAPIRIYTLIYNKTNVHTRLKGSLQVRDEAPRGFYISPLIGAILRVRECIFYINCAIVVLSCV